MAGITARGSIPRQIFVVLSWQIEEGKRRGENGGEIFDRGY
jgi:hypothetical protein